MSPSIGALFGVAVAYLGLLFGVAYATERGLVPTRLVRHPLTYALSLGVYATSWTYSGASVSPGARATPSPPLPRGEAAIEAEQARQGTGGGAEEEPPSPEEEQF